MGSGVKVKIIKPPIDNVTSGKIFKPSKAFRNKMWFQSIFLAAIIWFGTNVGYLSFLYFLTIVEPSKYPSFSEHLSMWLLPMNVWTVTFILTWLLPAVILIHPYFRSIEYSVKGESGKTMPEIYVKKGIITVTRKHVPFRTITNISSKKGLFDRLFGIGSVHIETAGYSGSQQQGPESKLEGIVFYEEVRDFILNELRKFREPYVIGTEVIHPIEKPVPKMEGLEDEILITLREIRDILKNRSH